MRELSRIMRARRTAKVLAEPENPLPVRDLDPALLDAMLADAGQAPFHYPAKAGLHGKLASPVPWRFHKLDARACRALMRRLMEEGAESGKIANMLAACDFLVLATWLPEPGGGTRLPQDHAFAGTPVNMEHLAAASAATYGLILRATEEGFRSYWSSGGILASREMLARLGVDAGEILIGAVFLFPQETGAAPVVPGKLAEARGPLAGWSRWVRLDELDE